MKLGNLNIPSKRETRTEVRKAIASNAEVDAIVEAKQTPTTRTADEPEVADESEVTLKGRRKLSRLVEHDFPFDESQKEAIDGLAAEQYACMTGAAGTGKTTCTKAVVDKIVDDGLLAEVNMAEYFSAADPEDDPEDKEDDYATPTWVPSVAVCAFTGRASQMVKKNFPRDWHGNIMTIHRLLAYVPEYYEDFDEETGGYRNKMRFVPSYTADCKLPWDVIIIDEAGMLSTELWENLWAACKPGCRIIMIGDINQLPPVHGRSVFGFAMSKWPTWELKKVHRQKGQNNPIVDNAWRVIHGQMPESEGRFQMIPLKGDAQMSSRHVRAMLPALKERKVYDPIRDTCITPINGEEGSRGFALGQLPLNREFALIFNPSNQSPRFVIDGGRDKKHFAVGDKVMATKNDWAAGITNGMTGIIVDIYPNEGYAGDWTRFGTVEEVNERLKNENQNADDDTDFFSLEDLEADLDSTIEKHKDAKEKRERGPSSHTVVVQFGEAEHGMEIPFTTLSEVGSLMTAYVVTCHKMQGGEAPTVVIICHDSHKAMLYREWLYTAITRASQRCILLYTPTALRVALNKQSIKGKTLREKIASFNEIIGRVDVTLPDSDSDRERILDRQEDSFMTPARLQSSAVKQGGLAQIIKKQRAQADANPEPPAKLRVDVRVRKEIKVTVERAEPSTPRPTVVDGGDVTPNRTLLRQPKIETPPIRERTGVVTGELPAPPKYVSTHGAVRTMLELERIKEQRLLTHQPKPAPKKIMLGRLNLGSK